MAGTGMVRFAAYISTAFLLGGCQAVVTSSAGGESGAQGKLIALGKNDLGEDCNARPWAAPSGAIGVKSHYKIFCGKWDSPSGSVYQVEASAESSSALNGLMQAGWWRERLNANMACNFGNDSRILGDIPIRVLDCHQARGDWPHVAIGGVSGGAIYLADGIPRLLPNIATAIGILSGRSIRLEEGEGNRGDAASLASRLEKLGKFGTGDQQEFSKLMKLAEYENALGNHASAANRYTQAIELLDKLQSSDSGGKAEPTMNLALEQSNQERYAAADALFDVAQKLIENAVDPTLKARLVSYRAMHAANQHQSENAIALAQEALRLQGELMGELGIGQLDDVAATGFIGGGIKTKAGILSLPSDRVVADQTMTLYLRAIVEYGAGQRDAAAETLREAKRAADLQGVPRWWRANLLELDGALANSEKNYSSARSALAEAISRRHEHFGASRTEGLYWLALGAAYAGDNYADDALKAYREGFRIIDAANKALTTSGGGVPYDVASPFFALIIAAAEREGADRQALMSELFDAAQVIRGAKVASAIAQTAVRYSSSDPKIAGLTRDLQESQRNLDQLNERLNIAEADAHSDPVNIKNIKEQIEAVREKAGALEQDIQVAFPQYRRLLDAPAKSSEVMALLRGNEAIVQIIVGSPKSLVLFIDNHEIKAYQADLSSKDAEEIVHELRAPFDASTLKKFHVQSAYALYQVLFAPVADRVSKLKHLLIVPTGPLLSLPFGVLVTQPHEGVGKDQDYRSVKWLGADVGLTLAPSIRSFIDVRKLAGRSGGSRSIIGFGDPAPLAKSDVDAIMKVLKLPEACRTKIDLLPKAPRLVGVQQELGGVVAALGGNTGELVYGPSFTKSALLGNGRFAKALSESRIVYFATHGLVPADLGDCLPEPALLAAHGVTPDSNDNGLLMSSDIVTSMRLNADLVVLSACNTGGNGSVTSGESLTGLARAFFVAGARSLLVSHWSVDNAATIKLMASVFRNYSTSRSLGVADALRKSGVEMMQSRELSHPYYWAPFTVVGDGGGDGAL